MKPTVGRIVYFREKGIQYPAIVVGVPNGNVCNLTVFKPGAELYKWNVLQGEGDEQWDWMPYQKGQATKADELEKAFEDLKKDIEALPEEKPAKRRKTTPKENE